MITINVLCDFMNYGGSFGPTSERTSHITINENMIVQVSDLQVSTSKIVYAKLYLLNGGEYYIDRFQREELLRL